MIAADNPQDQPVTIDEISIGDDPPRWAELGFHLSDGHLDLGSVRVRLSDVKQGIQGWSLRALRELDLDGLPTGLSRSDPRPCASSHPNGIHRIDHLVAISPDLDRSVEILKAAGLDLRRVREEPTPAGAPRQAFFRLGDEILEVIQEPSEVIARQGGTDRPMHFWGLALLTKDLEQTSAYFGDHLSEIRQALQPGRLIASVRRSAGLSLPVALIQ